MAENGRPGPPELPARPGDSRRGFTLVEVIIAVVILTCGVLGMAGTTALVVRQITLSDLATERCAAIQTAIERLRAQPYSSLSSGSDSVGIFAVQWTVASSGTHAKSVRVVTTGPGMTTEAGGFPVLAPAVADTVTYTILEP